MSETIRSYTFKYTRTHNDILRPMLRVKLRHRGKETPSVFVVVDTGADRCMFDDQLALLVGINVSRDGASSRVVGIGGSEEAAVFPIDVVFPDLDNAAWEIQAQSKRLPDGFSGMLGHGGFLGRRSAAANSAAETARSARG